MCEFRVIYCITIVPGTMLNSKSNPSEWYNEIIETAELVDKRYPVKGMNVFPPYGMKLIQLIDAATREACDRRGFEETMFPLLITRDQLSAEFEHIKGFESEVFWVTRGGLDNLDVEMALRPTSEAAMYPMFALWIRAHTDLPKRIYQIVTTYRYETKHTRAFIRDREIHFFEAHTAHATFNDAEKQMKEYMDIMRDLCDKLCLPYIINRRPEWDKFPGAQYSLAFDLLLSSGRNMQIGTIHQYGENFSKNYGIEYTDAEGQRKLVHQTTYGMSGRLVAAIVFAHGDNKGLVLPPAIAPIQVVIVPIPGDDNRVDKLCMQIESEMKRHGIRVHLDSRDSYTPGFKYNDWEMRGVPVRIEIGAKEAAGSFLTVVPRDLGKRQRVNLIDLGKSLQATFDRIQRDLLKKAENVMNALIKIVDSLEDAKSSTGMMRLFWCGEKECADKIEAESELTCLGYPVNVDADGKCVVCSKPGKAAFFAKTY